MRLLRDILLAVLVALLISIAGVVGSIGTLPKRGRRGSRDGRSSAGLPEHAELDTRSCSLYVLRVVFPS